MEVILREDIENLGTRGQVVKVASGYARNFLLPKRLAVAATESNKKIVEQERQAHLRKEAKVKGEAEDLAKIMTGTTVRITQKAGENDQLFGSVTSKDIADGPHRAELQHRPAQDPTRRAHPPVGRIQSPGSLVQGRLGGYHRSRRQRRVDPAADRQGRATCPITLCTCAPRPPFSLTAPRCPRSAAMPTPRPSTRSVKSTRLRAPS